MLSTVHVVTTLWEWGKRRVLGMIFICSRITYTTKYQACRLAPLRISDAYRMRVCKTCDVAMDSFRKALLLGQAEEAMSAYSTGCVNLDRPYTIYHGEVRGPRRGVLGG